LTPTVSYALTGGPTSPEFSSFEPVDTTDMVNLATGEFNYNLPLIEVPGPEGGYPLSLSYHAGIRLDQEASWVGLGFTLNPGAINRTINGYADDNLFTKSIIKDYWGGGSQVSETFDFSLTIYGKGINYSLAETHDTYRGFSSNSAASAYVDPTGTGLTAMGVSLSSKGLSTFASVAGLGSSAANNNSGKISSFTTETDKGMFGYFSPGISAFVSLKDYYTRYWSDESQGLITYGSLFPGLADTQLGRDFYDDLGDATFNSFAFDLYEAYDNSPIPAVSSTASDAEKLAATADDQNDVKRQLGGALPSYDRYEVLGQGIGGLIQPYIFENGDLFGQNIYGRGLLGGPDKTQPNARYGSLRKFSNKRVDFRFLNDLSNSLTIDPAQLQIDGATASFPLQQTHSDPQGFNNSDELNAQKLAGSKHVDWFTNEEIASGYATEHGLIDSYQNRSDRKLDFDVYANYMQPESCLPYSGVWKPGAGEGSFVNDSYSPPSQIYNSTIQDPKFNSLKPRKVDLRKKIGGFKITNETGAVYHYALPVYSYNEYSRTKLKDPRKGTPTFREYHNDDPYAYTWLLTAITGPDYVDANLNGVLDDGDLGYWVKFDYGRWADSYQWRTPHTGYMDEIDSEYATFSYGIKELYYLDAIETRSHKAIFIKSKRKDGRGVTSRLEGGSNPREYNMIFSSSSDYASSDKSLKFSVAPVSTMKLDAIYLFDKKDLAQIPIDKARGEMYNEAPTDAPHHYNYAGSDLSFQIQADGPDNYTTVSITTDDYIPVKYHNGDLVYDNDDIHDLPEFTQKALRVVKLNADYSLTQGVPNSFGFFSDGGDNCRVDNNLTEVCSDLDRRIGGAFEWPITGSTNPCFDGFLGSEPFCCQQLGSDGTTLFRDNLLFYSKQGIITRWYTERGDVHGCENFGNYRGGSLKYPATGKLTLKSVELLGSGGVGLLPPVSFAYDNNPDYQSNFFDEWGMFKQDFVKDVDDANRRITTSSASQVNAWSLSSISTSLGGKINVAFEANQYGKSVYNDFSVFPIEKMEAVDPDNVNVYFREKGLDIGSWFKAGDEIDMNAFFVYQVTNQFKLFYQQFVSSPGNSPVVVSFDNSNNVLTVQNQYLHDFVARTSYFVPERGRDGITFPVVSHLFSGFIKANDPLIKYAGGIRVKSLNLVDDSFGTSSTTFSYNASDGKSTGVTSFKPYILPAVHVPKDVDFFQTIASDPQYVSLKKELTMNEQAWQRHINQTFDGVLTFARETVPPGVIYGGVTSRAVFNSQVAESYSITQFRTYDAGMVTKEIQDYSTENFENRLVSFSSKVGSVGSPLSTQVFDNSGALIKAVNYGHLLDSDIKDYEQSILDTKQGTIQQAFNKRILVAGFRIQHSPPIPDFPVPEYMREKALMTLRQEQSDVVTSIEEIDYKKGTSTITKKLEFDFYSGEATKILTSDSYGNNYLSVTTPAYHIYPAMGLKIYNDQNKNMLTQGAASSTFLVDDSNEPGGLLSASVQTWSDQVPVLNLAQLNTNVWRKKSAYAWNGTKELNTNGSYPIDDFSANPFNASEVSKNTNWQKAEEVTLYDPYSHVLELSDINENRSSSKMDPRQMKVIASTSNAAYAETAYSGAEFSSGNSFDEGGVNRGDGSINNLQSHTGKYSLLVGSSKTGFNCTLKSRLADLSRKYRASAWVYIPGAGEIQTEMDKVQLYCTVNGSETSANPVLQKSKSKNWYLVNLDIVPDGSNDVFIGVRNNSARGVYFDDFRVHPLDASMVSYVYDAHTGELNYQLDANNIYTRYEYDAMGRLIRTSREQMNFDFGNGKESYKADRITNETLYNYGKK
jgi:hypothetical protein